jgi:hypothetical protein
VVEATRLAWKEAYGEYMDDDEPYESAVDLETPDLGPLIAYIKQSSLLDLWPSGWPPILRLARFGEFPCGECDLLMTHAFEVRHTCDDDVLAVADVLDQMHGRVLERLTKPGDVRLVIADVRLYAHLVHMQDGAIHHYRRCATTPRVASDAWLKANLYSLPEYKTWDQARLQAYKATDKYKAHQAAYERTPGRLAREQNPTRLAKKAQRERDRRARAKAKL